MTGMCLTLAIGLMMGADPCVSGVPVGKRPGPYSFLVATGPQRGQQTCYICEQAEKPAVVVFARTLNEPLAKLLAAIDTEGMKKKETGFKVWLTQLTAKADLNAIAKFGQTKGLKNVPMGAFEDVDGPPAYKLTAEADVTVLLFVKEKVVANFAYRKGELTDDAVKAILAKMPDLWK